MGFYEEFIGVNFWTALFTLLNFLLVLYVGKKYLFGPVMKIIEERQAEIDSMYTAAGKARADALDMEDQYKQKLSTAQATSERMVKEAVLRGQSREEEILRSANDEADSIRRKAAADIAREKEKAINDAKNELSNLAIAIAGKVVGRELTAVDQVKLVDDFIHRLGDEA